MTDDKMKFVNASDYSQNLDHILEGDLSASTNKPGRSPASYSVPSTSNQTALNLGSNRLEIESTLDEPVSVTIKRDLMAVAYKLGHVFFPKKSNLLLRDWDLWGIFIIFFKLLPSF